MSHPWKFAAAVAVALLTGFAVAAPVPPKADDSPAAKARAALDQKVTLKAEGKSLTELVEMVKEATKAEVVFDTATFQQFGFDVNSLVVNCDVKEMKLREVMKSVLGKMNLRCGVTAAGLCISTEDGLTAKQLRHRVDVDAADRPLGDLLRSLADQSGTNVVFDSRPGVKLTNAPVTLKADDVPVETAVRLAAEIGGYGVVRMGNVLFVTTTERADKLAAVADPRLPPAMPNPVFPIEPFPLPGGPGIPGGIVPPAVDPPAQEKR
jgi:type II secretory pathway component GspD/PulD (secretin)